MSMEEAGISILVVDDNTEDASLLEANLAQSGHSRRLHFCRTTTEAKDILKKGEYDIVITDHRPPLIDIFQLMGALNESENRVPVVVLTARGTEKLASEAIKQGAYDYLTKEELGGASIMHILKTVLERRRLKEEAKNANELLRKMAIQDSLTGVHNRRYLQDKLDSEFLRSQRYHRPLSVIMIDIDYFKDINDCVGHLGGDQVLTDIASALTKEVRCVDIVARYGGDEFGIILPETSLQDAMNLAERLRERISRQAHTIGSSTWHVTASIGVSALGPDVSSSDDLIAHADKMLYQAKSLGRNQICSTTYRPGKIHQNKG